MTGADVKALRGAMGLTAYALGDVLGVDISTIYRWESARKAKVPMQALAERMLTRLNKLPEGELAELGRRVREHLVSTSPLHALRVMLDAILKES